MSYLLAVTLMSCFCQRQAPVSCLAGVVKPHSEQSLSAAACCSAGGGSVEGQPHTVHSKCQQLMCLASPADAHHSLNPEAEATAEQVAGWLRAMSSPLTALKAEILLWTVGETYRGTTNHHVAVSYEAGSGTANLVVAAPTVADLAVLARRMSCPCQQAYENLSQASSPGLASLSYRCSLISRQVELRPWKPSRASQEVVLASRLGSRPLDKTDNNRNDRRGQLAATGGAVICVEGRQPTFSTVFAFAP